MEDRRRRDAWRHARFLRLLSDRLCSGVRRKRLASELRAVGRDPARLGGQRAVRLAAVRLDGRQGRPAPGADHRGAERLARDRGDGADAGRRVDLPGRLPLFCRVRGNRPLFGRYHPDAGVFAGQQARLVHRDHHDDAARGPIAGSTAGRVCRTLYRLARDGRGRVAAGLSVPLHPRFRPRIAALAAAPGPGRRGAAGARLGAEDGSRANRLAGGAAGDRAHALARDLQIPAQHYRRLPDRADPDRRRRAGAVAGDPVRHGAQDHPARGIQAGDLDQPRRRSPAGSSARGSPTRGDAAPRASSAA